MADVINEVQSLRNFVGGALPPSVQYKLMNMPTTYVAGVLAIDFADSRPTSETAATYRLDRLYQFVYFGANSRECVQSMQALQQAFSNSQVVPLVGGGNLRLGEFSFGQAFKTETVGVSAIIGMLPATLREERPQQQYEKIMNVTARQE